MQNELQQDCGSILPSNTLPHATNRVRLRNRAALATRLSTVLGSAQAGFKSAVEFRRRANMEGRASEWERAKVHLPPGYKEWIERAAAPMCARIRERNAPEVGRGAPQPMNSPSAQSGAEETGNQILQLRIDEIAMLNAELRQVEETFARRVKRGDQSEGANSARFRKRLAVIKDLVKRLLSSQRGFQLANDINQGLNLESAGWVSMFEDPEYYENYSKGIAERVMLFMLERQQIYGISLEPFEKIAGVSPNSEPK
jgi:hypothetical protein